MNTSWLRANLFATTALVGVAVAALAGTSAIAADAAASTAAASDAGAVEEVVVTGSHIPVAGYDTLQPAQNLTGETLKDRGFLNAGDALNELPIFGAAGNNNTGQQSGSQVGEQFVNLYGLGAQRTLVLVDGRRFVSGNAPIPVGTFGGAPPGQEVDLNDIPAGLIDHIEVVSVGGAPIYGADAIAGTVNVILKKNFQGVQVESQYGTSTQGDGKSYVGRALIGTNFADDKGNVTVAVEYTQQDGLTQANRPNTLPELDQAPGLPGQGCNFNACLVTNATVGSIFPGGIPTINAGALGLATQGGAILNAQHQPLAFAPNGNLVPVNLGIQNGGEVFAQGGDGVNLAPEQQFVAPQQRFLVDTLAHYDFTPHIQGYLETEFSQSNGTLTAGQAGYQSTFFAGQNGSAPLTFSLNNPYLTPQAVAALKAGLPAGQTTFGFTTSLNDVVPPQSTNDVETYRVVVGFKGDFEILGRKVNWDTSFNYGESDGHEDSFQINDTNFFNAINVVTGPNGQIECAVTANPPPLPVGNVSQPVSVSGCQPLDLFGLNAASAAAKAFIVAPDLAESIVTQRDVQVNLNGSPFDIWAGPVQLAGGFEFRQEGATYNVDEFALEGSRNAPATDVAGSYNTTELYAEATVPIISPSMHIPFVYSVEFNGAYRYIDNSLSGPVDVYTLGGKYRPIQDLELRGNYTHSVRAPSIEELFLPTAGTQSFAQDPCDATNITAVAPAARAANCAAAFAALGAPLAGFNSEVQNASVLGTTGGNPHLQDETAASWTAGFVARPHWVPHLSVAVDWVSIYLTNPITSLTLTQTLDACYDAATTVGNQFCNLFTRAPGTGQINGFNLPLANTGAQGFSGIQMQSDYSFDINEIPFIEKIHLNPNTNYGNLSFSLSAFFENSHYNEILGVITPTRGNIGDPVWKVNGSVRYRLGPWNFYLNGRYISPGRGDVTLPAIADQIEEVGNYWVWNTVLSYDVTKRVTVQVAVNDLFNQNPPEFAALLSGAAESTYDYFGQQVVFTVKAKF
jgi:iron complex outermembrane receptor protein